MSVGIKLGVERSGERLNGYSYCYQLSALEKALRCRGGGWGGGGGVSVEIAECT